MKNVLVPYTSDVDLTSIIDSVLTLNKAYNNDLTFAHISEKGNPEDEGLQKKIQGLLNGKLGAGSNLKFINKEGKTFHEIPHMAKEINADAVVMKNAETKGFHLFDDNTAYSAVVASPCPVLTLNQGGGLKKINSIVIPIDSSPESRQKIPTAINLAKHFGATIHVLAYASDSSGKEERQKLTLYSKQAQSYINEKGVKTILDIAHGKNLINMVITYSQKNDIDLIIITVEEETSFFSSSYAEKLVAVSPIPVLSVQPKDLKVSWAGL